jgi:hypothetical protein
MTPKNPVPARLFVLLAREAPVGVIIRRGPSKWTQLIHWDTKEDIFTPGQWFHGRIYEKRCGLSPDGKLFIYFAHKGNNWRRNPDYTSAWTAISKPPYFTALALWPKGDTWEGGGLFLKARHVWLNHFYGQEPHPDHKPHRLKVVPNVHAPNVGEHKIYFKSLELNGWQLIESGSAYKRYGKHLFISTPSSIWQKKVDTQLLTQYVNYHPHKSDDSYEYIYNNFGAGQEIGLENAIWADFDQQKRLVLAREGKIFSAALNNEGEITLTELADFNPNTPDPAPSPDWAKKW